MREVNFGVLKNEIAELLKTDMETSELFDMISNLNEMAMTDPLTGLYNRRFLSERLPAAYNSCLRLNKPFSIAMLDIDFFKLVNDAEGHLAGDAALQNIAENILYFIRSDTDFAVRYGGDEFLICFPGAVVTDCADICERIRARITAYPFCFENHEIHLSISVGVASNHTASGIEQLISLADQRLYEAKAAGRNRVIGEDQTASSCRKTTHGS